MGFLSYRLLAFALQLLAFALLVSLILFVVGDAHAAGRCEMDTSHGHHCPTLGVQLL